MCPSCPTSASGRTLAKPSGFTGIGYRNHSRTYTVRQYPKTNHSTEFQWKISNNSATKCNEAIFSFLQRRVWFWFLHNIFERTESDVLARWPCELWSVGQPFGEFVDKWPSWFRLQGWCPSFLPCPSYPTFPILLITCDWEERYRHDNGSTRFVSSRCIDPCATWPTYLHRWPWPEVKFLSWPFKVILYMNRLALTRQTWWYQNNCSILNS